jgi:hypothetical protein
MFAPYLPHWRIRPLRCHRHAATYRLRCIEAVSIHRETIPRTLEGGAEHLSRYIKGTIGLCLTFDEEAGKRVLLGYAEKADL